MENFSRMTRKRCRESSAPDKDGSMKNVCSDSNSKEELRVGQSSPRNSNGAAGEGSDKDDAAFGVGVDMVNPLDLINNGLFNVAENYEILADKKRKALLLRAHSSR